MTIWTSEELNQIGAADELEIAPERWYPTKISIDELFVSKTISMSILAWAFWRVVS